MNASSESNPQTPETEEIKEVGSKEINPVFQEFLEKINRFPTPEEKIAEGIRFMRSSISQEGTARFREFWEARKVLLPFFKENINSAIRSKLWGEYIELTQEARRLKEILEEQSVFAMEQIDLAIAALEKDLNNFQSLLSQVGEISFPEQSPTIKSKEKSYNLVQREINLLNTLASRLNGFRTEIMKTDMRVRFKTKFFKRLSELGQQIFPKRKTLIEQISQEFEKDVDQFIAQHFQDEKVVGAPYYALREEIKALQSMAKVLTLSSSAFNKTRLALSECWDKIKVLEKEHKKEIHAKKQVSHENRAGVEQKIEELKSKSQEMSLSELDSAIEEILKEMRTIDLQRPDVTALKEMLTALRSPHLNAQAEKAKSLEAAEREKLRLKKEKIQETKNEIALLLKEGSEMEPALFEERFNAIKEQVKSLGAAKTDQQQFDRSLRQLKDLLAERKERKLLDLSEHDRDALENLRTLLSQKKERRQEIKEHIEFYRRAIGSSNLDFEKAMLYREQIDQEKELLEKSNLGIEEIEQKIAELEG